MKEPMNRAPNAQSIRIGKPHTDLHTSAAQELRHVSHPLAAEKRPAAFHNLQPNSKSDIIGQRAATEANLVPAANTEMVDTMPTENRDTSQAPLVWQASVEFLYRVVCHHNQRISFDWKPEKSFRNMTIAELDVALSKLLEWSQFQHLQFRLTAPRTRAEQLISRGLGKRFGENHFDAMKEHFAAFVKECITEMTRGETLLIAIDIEALAEVDLARKRRGREVMDFCW
jgi:hypothetical protein